MPCVLSQQEARPFPIVFFYILQRDYYQRYPNPMDVPEAEYAKVRWLQQQNHALFERAEELGW